MPQVNSVFSSLAMRRALRATVVVFLAIIFSHYILKASSFWLPVAALLLTQIELGFPLYRGLQRFFWLILLFGLGGQLALWVQHLPLLLLPTLLVTVILTSYRYADHAYRYLGLHFSLLALSVLVLSLLLPVQFLNSAYLWDLVIGGAVGLGGAVFLFPDRPDLEFPKRVVPLLQDLSAYLGALIALLLREEGAEDGVQSKRQALERRWANKDEAFPVWVFETGFNPALKPGQYFFVVHLGQITEILFALHYFARHSFPSALLSELGPQLRDSAGRSQELLSNLILLLKGAPLPLSQTDFAADLPVLEDAFQSKIQLSLELLDISRDYIYLAAFIRYLKDLRLQLLQLASAFGESA